MANVNIHAEHREILEALITSAKVKSLAGAVKTGPFREQRDAYVFAASLGLALGDPTVEDMMPKSKKDSTMIRDSVFLGADGATELSLAVVMIGDSSQASVETAIARSLECLTETALQERLSLMDRYAHAGFQWLSERYPDESSIRELILSAIHEVDARDIEPVDDSEFTDPLLEVLLD